MKKLSYYSGEDSEIEFPSPEEVDSISAERGSRGIGLTEQTSEFDDSIDSNIESYEDQNILDKTSEANLMSMLVSLGDAMDIDGQESLANFTDFLLQKFAEARPRDSTDLFNSLIIKIKRADISDTNEVIKKLTKIYSRTILLENMNKRSLEESKKSAYKKVLHRASQYLSEG